MLTGNESRSHIAKAGRHYASIVALALLTAGSPASEHPPDVETPAEAFSRGNAHAMDRMMMGMAEPSSGDVDTDFVNMMEPHHRGAIDMAVLQLRYGKNKKLHRIAQEIIVSQGQEIDAMRLALNRPLSSLEPAPTQVPVDVGSTVPHHHSEPRP